MKKYFFVLLLIPVLIFFISCSDISVSYLYETIIFEKPGLVDSAAVNQCVPDTKRFFTDTLDLRSYTKLIFEFDGLSNSDGSFIKAFWNTQSSNNNEFYSAIDRINVSAFHRFELMIPAEEVWFEIRLYINPPVCGTGEFKFTRARDLKIKALR